MPRRPPRILAASLSLCCLFACTTQTAMRSQKIRVSTNPPRAMVWKQDKTGKRNIGRSPAVVDQTYPVLVKKVSPWWWVAVGGAGVVASVGLAFYNSDQNSTVGQVLTYTGAGLLSLSLLGYYLLSAYVTEELPGEPETLVLGASLEGYLDQEMKLTIPGLDKQAHLVLEADPDRPAIAKAPVARPAHRTEKAPVPGVQPGNSVVAVFDIEDASRKFRAATMDQLTEYLVARLTQVTRFRVVPRDQIRERLVREKRESFSKCFDESCQIQLGKALAAQKILATKILRVGKRCAVTASLYDLKSETTESSALSRTDCDEDSLMDAMDRVARQLSAGDHR